MTTRSRRGGNEDLNKTNEVDRLNEEIDRRQKTYILRENALHLKIEELEQEIAHSKRAKAGWSEADEEKRRLRKDHEKILGKVGEMQEKTSIILQEQERDLLRAFRARLFDIQSELEGERTKKDKGADEWVERGRALEADLEWSKQVADRLDRLNQALQAENNRLKSQYQNQEGDRQFMIKQLVVIKKENAKFRMEYTALETENSKLQTKLKEVQAKLAEKESVITSLHYKPKDSDKPKEIDNNSEER
jgi:chromosome segregation ATPase